MTAGERQIVRRERLTQALVGGGSNSHARIIRLGRHGLAVEYCSEPVQDRAEGCEGGALAGGAVPKTIFSQTHAGPGSAGLAETAAVYVDYVLG